MDGGGVFGGVIKSSNLLKKGDYLPTSPPNSLWYGGGGGGGSNGDGGSRGSGGYGGGSGSQGAAGAPQ